MDIVFLIDGSGSINQNDFNRMKGFVQAVMDQFEGTDTLVKTGHLGLGVGGRGRLARERHPGRGWGQAGGVVCNGAGVEDEAMVPAQAQLEP